MKIHHINCGSLCPLGGSLIDGFSKGPSSHLSCHCLLIETPNSGLVLVDTGLGHRELDPVNPTLARFHQIFDRPHLKPLESAIATVKKLGFDPRDVRHIIATHLDFDHIGGVRDFPEAVVHVTELEMKEAIHAKGFVQRRRFPLKEFTEHKNWIYYPTEGDNWYNFKSVRNLKGLPPEILLIPLRGHTLGQVGVAIQQKERWLFHAADSYLYRGEMDLDKRRCPVGMEIYQRVFDTDHKARVENQYKLRKLMQEHHHEISIFCSHDFKEFQKFR